MFKNRKTVRRHAWHYISNPLTEDMEARRMNPLFYRWEGDGFKPIPRQAKEADKRYVIGEVYALEQIEERSLKSHRQYFAAIREAWLNLPEGTAASFPTPEHLRKHALIRAGFFDKRSIQAANKTEALRLAAFIRPIDEYAIVTVSNALVEVYTAKSQSHRAMPKAEFQESKTKVLEWIATTVGVTKDQLLQEAKERVE
jgi:hypothetical protein